MANIVFILGAGASRQAGAPLMKDFLDVADDLQRRNRCGDATDAFRTVFDGISALQPVHSKAQLDIQNLESVFGAFEMARTLGSFGSLRHEEIEAWAPAMRRVIVKTLEETISFPVSEIRNGRGAVPSHHVSPPVPYELFARLVLGCFKASPPHSASVITFNYDLAADFAFYDKRLRLDYALSSKTDVDAIPFLKLHGSLNWGRCQECTRVIAWHLDDYFETHSWGGDLSGITQARLTMGSQLPEWTHCDKPLAQEPELVPPTWSKTQYHKAIQSVWRRAAEQLSLADSIFVMGFSLPLRFLFLAPICTR